MMYYLQQIYPGQPGAPFFSGTNIIEFLEDWELMTIDWAEKTRIKHLPQFAAKWVGKWIRQMTSYKEPTSWATFKQELLDDFKALDEEHEKHNGTYLQQLVEKMRQVEGLRLAAYRTFIIEFAEKSELLVEKGALSEYKQVLLLLQAFPDKVGNKICKQFSIGVEKPATVIGKYRGVKEAALKYINGELSQMTELQRLQAQLHDGTILDKLTKTCENPPAVKSDFENQMLEMIKRVGEMIAMLKDTVVANTVQSSNTAPAPQVEESSRIPASDSQRKKAFIRGCFWDGDPTHQRDDCNDLRAAIARGEVYKEGRMIYLGSKGTPGALRVPIPTLDDNGKVIYQREWVRQMNKAKESEYPITRTPLVQEGGDAGNAGKSVYTGERDTIEVIPQVPRNVLSPTRNFVATVPENSQPPKAQHPKPQIARPTDPPSAVDDEKARVWKQLAETEASEQCRKALADITFSITALQMMHINPEFVNYALKSEQPLKPAAPAAVPAIENNLPKLILKQPGSRSITRTAVNDDK